MQLLLLQFEPALARRLTHRLMSSRHGVQWCTHVDQARQARRFDVALLDVDRATRPVMQMLKAWRSDGMDQPVAMVTSPGQSRSRAQGLVLGADVGLIKPLDVDDVLGWIDTACSRRPTTARQGIDGLTTRLDARRDRMDDPPATLTALEWAVLLCLAERQGRIYSRQAIEAALRDQGVLSAASNSIEVIVSRLRKKIGPELISTHRGIGYRLEI